MAQDSNVVKKKQKKVLNNPANIQRNSFKKNMRTCLYENLKIHCTTCMQFSDKYLFLIKKTFKTLIDK